MTDLARGTCRSCHQPIEWAETPSGKRMPLDPTPSERGNLVVDPVTGHAVTAKPTDIGPRRISHFATCPNASTHRRPR